MSSTQSQQKFSVLLSKINHLQTEIESLQQQISSIAPDTQNNIIELSSDTILGKSFFQSTIYTLTKNLSTVVLPTDISDGYQVKFVNQTSRPIAIMSDRPMYSFFFAQRGSNVIVLQQNLAIQLTYFGNNWTAIV